MTRRRRGPGDLLVVVSDGVPDYLGRAFGAGVEAALRAGAAAGGEADAARATARALISRAGAAGAGDNLTAAVLLVRRPRRAFGWR